MLHCHHQNDSCIKMGSDDSHFNVPLIVRCRITRQCPQTTTFKEKGEPKHGIEPVLSVHQPNALLLDQTSSLKGCVVVDHFYIALFSTLGQTHCV